MPEIRSLSSTNLIAPPDTHSDNEVTRVSGSRKNIGVVLVHGAWADGSSGNDVIAPLLSRGIKVLAAPIPQRFMGERMGARSRSEKVDHTPLVSAPKHVVELILEAVASSAVRTRRFGVRLCALGI